MKRFYLSRNQFSKEYSLDGGAFGSHREILGKEEDYLIAFLKEKVDKKRKSELYLLNGEISKEQIRNIRKYFSDSKVKVSLETRANLG